ncbi:MAG: hypothetical protein MJK12_15525 [Colwellia sp.]|nr:hypothetical protein [Colwellia sp.]
MQEFLTNPLTYAFLILTGIMGLLFGALFGKFKNADQFKENAYRETGIEMAFVFFPLFLYSIAHVINGTFINLLKSPELPVIAMILAGMTIFNVLKASTATEGKIELSKVSLLILVSLFIFMCCTGLVFWLTLDSSVSDWVSIINCGVLFIVVLFSFGISAPLNAISKDPSLLNAYVKAKPLKEDK